MTQLEPRKCGTFWALTTYGEALRALVAGHGGQLAVGSFTTGGEALGAPPWVVIGVLTTRLVSSMLSTRFSVT